MHLVFLNFYDEIFCKLGLIKLFFMMTFHRLTILIFFRIRLYLKVESDVEKKFTDGSRSDRRSHFLAEIEIGQSFEGGIEIGS